MTCSHMVRILQPGKPSSLRACNHLSLNGMTIGIEPTRLRVLELRFLEAGVTHAQIQSAESALAIVRMHKDETEVAAMQKAVDIAQTGFIEHPAQSSKLASPNVKWQANWHFN